MPMSIANNPIYLQNGLKPDRTYLKSQKNQNAEQKVFHRDTLEITQLSRNREEIMDKIKHTVMQSATAFSDTRAEILKEIREKKGQYGYSDIVNACGLSYAKLYSEIEQRHEKEQEQYYKADGTVLTKEEEMEWLDMQYEQEVEWQKSCARIAAQREAFLGHIPEVPTKEIEELEDALYQVKDAYLKWHQRNNQPEEIFTLQNFVFGSSRMYEILNRLENLQGRVE